MSEQFPPAEQPDQGVPLTPPPPPAAPTPPPPPPPPPPAGAVPPPPAPGYAAPVPSPVDGPWSVGNAFSYGWAQFQKYLGPLLLAMLVLFVIGAILTFIWYAIVAAIGHAIFGTPGVTLDPNTGVISTSGGPGLFGTLLLGVIGGLVYYTVIGFVQGVITRAALRISEGQSIALGEILSTDRLGPLLITALFVGVATSIGYLFCGVGAIIVSFFLSYTFYFLLDQDMEPTAALSASFNFVKDHLGDLIVFYLVSLVAYIVGAILCGIGLLVAAPVVLIATAYTYKKFTNQAVAA